MKRIKVRFNLSRGKYYMMWKIQYPSGAVEYCNPQTSQLILKGCTLKNNRKTAEKIYNGEHKTVCAWILCEDIQVKYNVTEWFGNDPNNIRLSYNPRVNPFWVLGKPIPAAPADGFKFTEIGTAGKQLFVTKF